MISNTDSTLFIYPIEHMRVKVYTDACAACRGQPLAPGRSTVSCPDDFARCRPPRDSPVPARHLDGQLPVLFLDDQIRGDQCRERSVYRRTHVEPGRWG